MTEPALSIRPSDSCPCGSKRKFKKCCGIKNLSPYEREEAIEDSYALIRRAEDRIFSFTLKFVESYEDKTEEDLDELFEEFQLGLDDGYEVDDLIQMFVPWLLVEWPALEKESTEEIVPLAQLFINAAKDFGLRNDDIGFLQACLKSQVSWYRVDAVRPGIEITLTDIFSEETVVVREHSASEIVARGDYVMSRIISLFGVSALLGTYPRKLPASEFSLISSAKGLLKDEKFLSSSPLRELEENIPEAFFRDSAIRSVFIKMTMDYVEASSEPPILKNTDGDLVEMLDVLFSIRCPLEEVTRKLKPLSEEQLPFTSDEIQKALDEEEVVSFDWIVPGNKVHKSWSNTVMGSCSLRPDNLVISVNSRPRAELVKQRVMELLGSDADFVDIQPADPSVHKEEEVDPEILNSPEIQEQIKLMAKNHWDNWLDEPLPALQGETPREAAKSKLGRESLEALLCFFESVKRDDFYAPPIEELRVRLGLDNLT